MQEINKKLLIIKHGGLSEMAIATAPFAAIKKAYEGAHVTLLTEAQYVDFAKQSGFFDDVITDPMADWWQINTGIDFIKQLRSKKFDCVFDLETSLRTNTYFRLIGRKKPFWNGSISWCSHPYKNGERFNLYILDRWKEQLSVAGIKRLPAPDISFLKADISRFGIDGKFALIVPGGKRQKQKYDIQGKKLPSKHWHDEGFADVIKWFAKNGVMPVIIGTKEESRQINSITSWLPNLKILNLMDKTSHADIAELARKALVAVGNDNGPMYISAFSGCPSLLLYATAFSVPEICSPMVPNALIIEEFNLEKLDSDVVINAIKELVVLDSGEKLPNSPPPDKLMG